MTPAQYKSARQARGTQQGVAAKLGIAYTTIQRRESGEIRITREAVIALEAIPPKK
jgi:ribosome-binding protein aMBF1 (putative translation factor)